MGSTKFWYFPSGQSRAAVVDFGRIVAERQGPTPVLQSTVVESLGGSIVTTTYGGRTAIRLQHTWDTRGTGRTLRRKLFNLWNHLQRGGTCFLAEDDDYAFAGFASTLPGRHATRVNYTSNIFVPLAGAADIQDREVVIQSDPELAYAEMGLCSDHSNLANYVDLGSSVVWPYQRDARWALIRELGSYPSLRVPAADRNGEPLTHDHETVFHLDLPLEEDPDGLEALLTTQVGDAGGDVETTPEGPGVPPGPNGPVIGQGPPGWGGGGPGHGWEW